MKKILLLIAISGLLFNACKKSDSAAPAKTVVTPVDTTLSVEKKNRAAVIYFGEDWCPPCGSYGGPTLDSCLIKEGTLLTGIKVNGSSNNTSLNCVIGNAMFSDFNTGVFASANAIPSMAINNTDQPVYTSVSTNYSQAVQKATTFSTAPVIAAVALRKTVSGDSLAVQTKVHFYNAIPAGSNYKLTVFVVEDNVVASQHTETGTVNNYAYRNLVRTTNNNTSYSGITINNSTAITVDQEFNNTYKIYLNPSWNKSNIKVVAVLWKMNATPGTIINSNVAK